MRLEYNSPTVLTFTIISTILLVIQSFSPIEVMEYFTIYSHWEFSNPLWYFRLFSHVLGHADWNHLLGNFTFILLIGPILEEKYGSKDVLFMIIVTAFVTGILHIIIGSLFGEPNTLQGLTGASGIVFMMILLSSIVNSKSGGIPMTFILVVALFLGKEVITSVTTEDNISQLAHIVGGIMGGMFGFYLRKARTKEVQSVMDKANKKTSV
ncbi:MAG: rhomboid family intramembrane serine protease [Bacteroidota bacterium]